MPLNLLMGRRNTGDLDEVYLNLGRKDLHPFPFLQEKFCFVFLALLLSTTNCQFLVQKLPSD